MRYQGKIHLTNMCLIYDEDGNILVQDRLKQDWPGLNLPGGHVEVNENIIDSVVREMKEETGLDIFNVEKVGYFEWNLPEKEERAAFGKRLKREEASMDSGIPPETADHCA